MKILQCHNLYQLAGGEDSVFKDERELLESRGHEVVQYILHNDAVNDVSKLRLAAGTVWSRKSAGELRELVRREKPDVAHFHNTLPLMSPSSYHAVRSEGVPVVQTLHNYRLLCPKATFFRDNHICEECLHKRVKLPAIKHGCYRDSRAATAAVTAMLT
ncbi:MAG: glycosyltransferase, partial [Planctomycetota bacterium]